MSTRRREPRRVPARSPRFVGGNEIALLQGGDELFPRMCLAIDQAVQEVWIATYIFNEDPATLTVVAAMLRAAGRGVAVHFVVDGFGSLAAMDRLRHRFAGSLVRVEIFRPIERWYAWLQPGQLRRLHQKLCACDGQVAFVGGINLIDDRFDLTHGWLDAPRLDFAVEVRGPLSNAVQVATRALWVRAHLARCWRSEFRSLSRSGSPLRDGLALMRQMRSRSTVPDDATHPVRAAFLVRDNLRLRRAIERSYVGAIRSARQRVDIAVPYFYPGHGFMRALTQAARRGVRIRLLLQGKADYRVAALAAQVLYEQLRSVGVRIFEYTPAFLHAKVALVDDDWATVGSSNIDPLSLLLNLEANVVVSDGDFARALGERFEEAFAVSIEIGDPELVGGWRGWLRRALVAWAANLYLRVAGVSGRY